MHIADQVVLVTGANRGIGLEFVRELRARNARKIYASSRTAAATDIPGVEVVRLDLTDRDSIEAAARVASDVTVLVNNAGIHTGASVVTGDLADIRREMDTHFWGNLHVIRAFAPVLAANGGGAISNVLSASSWFAAPGNGAYGAAKAAAWNMVNAVRLELADQGTLVQAVMLGATDTDFAARYTGPKTDPREVARAALDGLAAGEIEVVVDDWSAMVKASLAEDPKLFYDRLATLLP